MSRNKYLYGANNFSLGISETGFRSLLDMVVTHVSFNDNTIGRIVENTIAKNNIRRKFFGSYKVYYYHVDKEKLVHY